MTLKKILEGVNAEGKIYLCDTHEWIGFDVPMNKVYEIREKIMELNEI